MGEHLVCQYLLLSLVGLFHRLENDEIVVVGGGCFHECLDVLGEAGTAIPDAGEEEVEADAGVGADPLTHVGHIGPHPLAEVGDLVHERNAGGQHGVGRILGHLCATHIHDDEPVGPSHERFI